MSGVLVAAVGSVGAQRGAAGAGRWVEEGTVSMVSRLSDVNGRRSWTARCLWSPPSACSIQGSLWVILNSKPPINSVFSSSPSGLSAPAPAGDPVSQSSPLGPSPPSPCRCFPGTPASTRPRRWL